MITAISSPPYAPLPLAALELNMSWSAVIAPLRSFSRLENSLVESPGFVPIARLVSGANLPAVSSVKPLSAILYQAVAACSAETMPARLACGERASLVDDECVHFLENFEGFGVFYQHAGACATPHSHHDGHGSG